ncbi:MAG TPA: FAD binding domain-containing protein [Nocardioidaceae bacterium]|nr:FAD binding domain-containing protein [Nocardioidaceae bacterium]
MESPTVSVNGRPLPLGDVPPHTSALDWLRDQGLTGAKEGCAEGECGACSVLLARPGLDTPTEWTPLNACLLSAYSLIGQEVVTAEGLGTPETLHPVQHELAVRGGSQCGYCTPGFVCSMAAEYYRPGRSSSGDDFDEHAIGGNLCRCTGYRPILEAGRALGAPAPRDPLAERLSSQPPVVGPLRTPGFIRPESLAHAIELLADRPEAQVVAGCTDWGVEVNLRGARAALTVTIDQLPELRTLEVGDDAIEIGAALSLTEIERRLAGRVPLLDQVFPLFASRLIRNSATLGGNLGTASPIGDTPPALLALDASVVIAGVQGERVVPLDDFFTGYRETALQPGELIRSVRVPLPLAGVTAFHKIAKRRLDDISSVAVAFALDVHDGVVRRARIGLGGVAATPIRALSAEAALTGRPWDGETVAEAAAALGAEGTPMDDHRASAAYRSATLERSLLKLLAEAS